MSYYFPLQCCRADERGRRMNLYEFYKTEAEIMGKYANGELVEVVRCKDCRHFDVNMCVGGMADGDEVQSYDFCSYGERKEVNDPVD